MAEPARRPEPVKMASAFDVLAREARGLANAFVRVRMAFEAAAPGLTAAEGGACAKAAARVSEAVLGLTDAAAGLLVAVLAHAPEGEGGVLALVDALKKAAESTGAPMRIAPRASDQPRRAVDRRDGRGRRR